MSKEKESITEKEWEHAGLKCKVVFVWQSHRCGYVTVPKGHIAFDKTYEDLPIDVHGGLTYGDYDGKTKDEATFGFDCAHAGDVTGELGALDKKDHFWTLEEVVAETNRMAEQFQKLTLRAIIEHKLEYMPSWVKNNIQILVSDSTSEVIAPGVGDGSKPQEISETAYMTPAPRPQNSLNIPDESEKKASQ